MQKITVGNRRSFSYEIFIIGFMVLTSLPLTAKNKPDDVKKQQVTHNSNVKQHSEKPTKAAIPHAKIEQSSKSTIKPPELPKQNNSNQQLPSVVNIYDFLYSHQTWQTDNSKTPTSPFGTTNFNEFALKGNLYYLTPKTNRLPDFSTMTAIGTIYIPKLDIPKRTFTTGFPGVDKRFEWFGIRYIGGFKIQQDGQYRFRLVSDDGSKLWIDNKLIIDNDGIHPPQSKSATVNLNSGHHLIQVNYFQGPRKWIALQLYVTEPNGIEKIFSPELISNQTVKGEVTDSDKTKRTAKLTLKFVRQNQTQPQISTK